MGRRHFRRKEVTYRGGDSFVKRMARVEAEIVLLDHRYSLSWRRATGEARTTCVHAYLGRDFLYNVSWFPWAFRMVEDTLRGFVWKPSSDTLPYFAYQPQGIAQV